MTPAECGGIGMGLWSSRVVGVAVCLLGTATIGLAAEKTDQGPQSPDRNWQIGFTPSYSTGNFGTSSTSSFLYAPLSMRRLFKDGDITVIVPFVTSTTDGRTTIVGGNVTRVDDNSKSGSSGSGSDDDGGCSGKGQSGSGKDRVCGLTTRAPGQKVTTVGLGDIILKGRYYVVEERDALPLIALTARVKLPTANEQLGLGTGALDYGFGVEMSKMFGEYWIAFLDAGYNIIGDPDGLQFQNQHWYDVGAGYFVTRDLLASVYFEEYRAIVPGFVNARDFFFAMNYTVSSAWRLNSGVTVGVSNGAPDYAFSVGASYRF
ncbi:MAG: transporter [Nitrospira defluvii]|nr:transporter [Nitrospira defluvii]